MPPLLPPHHETYRRSGAIAFEMRLFTVAHVVARWYFLPAVRHLPSIHTPALFAALTRPQKRRVQNVPSLAHATRHKPRMYPSHLTTQGESLEGYPATEALAIAAGPAFGTLSFGGVLIAVVEILRAIANYIQQASADSDNILMVRIRIMIRTL